MAILRSAFRPRAHPTFLQAESRLDDATSAPPRASRSLDVAGRRRLRPTAPGPVMDRGSPAAMGAAARVGEADALPRPPGPFRAAADGGDASQSAKTLRSLAGPPQRQPLGARHPLPSPEKGRLRLAT